jgi:dihydrofolate reductase
MKVTLIAVTSIDGKTTKWENPNIYKWTSQEDHDNFFSHIEANNFIVLGSKTYEAAKSVIRLSDNRLTLVMTHSPKKFESDAIPGQLEFTNLTPLEIIEKYQSKKDNLLLTSGETINKLFFEAGLVDEILLTIEPYIFGSGNTLLGDTKLEIEYKLLSTKKLNSKGTLLLRYSKY